MCTSFASRFARRCRCHFLIANTGLMLTVVCKSWLMMRLPLEWLLMDEESGNEKSFKDWTGITLDVESGEVTSITWVIDHPTPSMLPLALKNLGSLQTLTVISRSCVLETPPGLVELKERLGEEWKVNR